MCTPGLCRRLGHTLTHEWNRAWNTHNQGGQLDDLGGEVRGGGWWCCWGRGGRGWCPEQDRKVSQDTICSLSGARCVGAHTDRSCRPTWSFLQTGARRGKERWEESFILKYNKTIKITLSSHLQHCHMYAFTPRCVRDTRHWSRMFGPSLSVRLPKALCSYYNCYNIKRQQ